MTALKQGESIIVLDNTDNKKRRCKVKAVDEDNQLLQIHYVGFNSRYDEWIDFTSDRIVESEDDDDFDLDEDTKAALGQLAAIDDVTAKIIPCFSTDLDLTTKKINAFPVATIHMCAESMKINIKTMDDRNLNKAEIIRLIISKIKSYLPSQCCICNESFRLKVTDVALFSCAGCNRASHDCEAYQDFRNSLPNGLLKGFVWLCEDCGEAEYKDSKPTAKRSTKQPHSQSVVGSGKSEVPVNKESETQAQSKVSDDTANLPNGNDSLALEICPEYKKSNCPHGIRGNKLIDGNKCKFSHPKPCQKYCGYGSRGEFGCKAGSKCPNFHPRLCRYSLSKKLCTNENCKFVHLKGTARRAAQKEVVPSSSLPKTKDETDSTEVPPKHAKSKHDGVKKQSNEDFLDATERMEKRFQELAESLNRRLLKMQQNMQAQQIYPPHQIIPYPPPTMMGYPHPQQFHAMPAQMGRALPHNPVPSSF